MQSARQNHHHQFNTQINDSTPNWRLPTQNPPLWQPDGQWADRQCAFILLPLPAPRGEVSSAARRRGVFSFFCFLSFKDPRRHPSDPTSSAHLPAGRREGQSLVPHPFPIKKPLPIAVGISVRNPEQQGGASSSIPTFHSMEAWSSPGVFGSQSETQRVRTCPTDRDGQRSLHHTTPTPHLIPHSQIKHHFHPNCGQQVDNNTPPCLQ